jgi:hypothetical protein
VKIKILPSALEDLDRGRRFYARQGKSVGDYFLDSLFSDIDSLELYAGIHLLVFDYRRLLEIEHHKGAAQFRLDPSPIRSLAPPTAGRSCNKSHCVARLVRHCLR